MQASVYQLLEAVLNSRSGMEVVMNGRRSGACSLVQSELLPSEIREHLQRLRLAVMIDRFPYHLGSGGHCVSS